MQELCGQRALVTGGTSGIGRATAEALAREGARVLISGRSEARGAEVVAAIEAGGGEAEFVRADLESPDEIAIKVSIGKFDLAPITRDFRGGRHRGRTRDSGRDDASCSRCGRGLRQAVGSI
jgi:short chain dehydrogenase